MQYEAVKFEIIRRTIGILKLNRPESLNSFNEKLLLEIISVCKEVSEKKDIKVLIITGEGYGFSTGGDVNLLQKLDSRKLAEGIFRLSTQAVRAVYELEIPVICGVNGAVAGASLALMNACDLIIASEKAKFGFTFINVAFCPDSGCSYYLAQKVGYHKALELLCFGRIITVEEAYGLNLVNTVVSADKVLETAMIWADKIVQGPFMTIKINKKILRQALSGDFYSQSELECLYQLQTWQSNDFREGVQAFLEKREPVFTGA